MIEEKSKPSQHPMQCTSRFHDTVTKLSLGSFSFAISSFSFLLLFIVNVYVDLEGKLLHTTSLTGIIKIELTSFRYKSVKQKKVLRLTY